MIRKAAIALRLRELASRGSLARSECSAALLQQLGPLLASGVVDWTRAGAGQRLTVREPVRLDEFIAQQFPNSDLNLKWAVGRVEGVARFRDSKAIENNVPEIVCLRAWSDNVLARDGNPADVSRATRQFGLFAFLLAEPSQYRLVGRCALVENPAVFNAVETLGLGVDAAILVRGRCSQVLLEWLGEQSQLELIHLPDYDPTGLSEFERIRTRLGHCVRLHAPAHLEVLFARYAKAELLANPTAQALLAGLRATDDPGVARIVALIDRHNGGLEQEALLISSTSEI